jgi:hypothetical protein
MTPTTITNKQQSIIILLHQFRFLNRIQIQALLKHKDHKTINLWLKDLTQKQYIERIYSTKITEINKPAIYYIILDGIRYLRTLSYLSAELKPFYRDKDRSEIFISKHILIADIWLDLQKRCDDKIKYTAATASDMADPDYKYNFLSELGSDLIFTKETKTRNTKKYYLLEILEPTLPLYSIRKKIQNYIDFYFFNSWEDNTDEDFPTILLICPDLSKLISVKRYARKLLSEYDDIKLKIQFEIHDEVKKDGITGFLESR